MNGFSFQRNCCVVSVESEEKKFGIKQIDKDSISTAKI